MTQFISPGATIGIIGGGVTAFQMANTANSMGMRTVVLAPTQTDIAFEKADIPLVGDATDRTALKELTQLSTVMTFTDENVDGSLLAELATANQLPSGVDILTVTQDRYLEKVFLDDLNMNILPYTQVITPNDIKEAVDTIGYPALLKPIQKGMGVDQQLLLSTADDVARAQQLLQQRPYILEAYLQDIKEVAVIVAKAGSEVRIGPVIQNYFDCHQLKASSVRADVDPAVIVEIRRIAAKISEKLAYTGIFSLEFFLASNGTLYVKRVYPGPKLYGHLMLNTSDISEYELHLRAILGCPLPDLQLAEDGVGIPLRSEDMDAVLTQIQIKPDWRFTFYPTGGELTGEIQIVGDLKAIKASVNATGHFVIQ